jgi:DNA invertase Pin-like site-specific DNA recombinase
VRFIQERVKAGIHNARAKGKRIGRPPKCLDLIEVSRLRAEGASWRAIYTQLRIGLATPHRAAVRHSKIRPGF